MTHNKVHNAQVVCLPHPDGLLGCPPMAPISVQCFIGGKPILNIKFNPSGVVCGHGCGFDKWALVHLYRSGKIK